VAATLRRRSIRETLPEYSLAAHTAPPPIASADGPLPTGIVAVTDTATGSILDTSIDENVASTATPGGAASTAGALFVLDTDLLTVKNSTISENLTLARSDTGSATVLGGGVFNNSLLLMDHVIVSRNTARAQGPAGDAQAGGIWNGALITGPPTLTLENSSVVGNALQASPGIPRQGGGLFTTFPVVRMNTLIAGNRPDQCLGCSPTAAMARRETARSFAARRSQRAASGRQVTRGKPAGLSR
jgi:hypothetical protein